MHSLVPVALVPATLAAASAGASCVQSRTAEISFDHAYARIGSRELRWGGTLAVEWARSSRWLTFRGRPDILTQESLTAKFMRSMRNGKGFDAVLLNVCGRWIGNGASLKDFYIEFGTGILLADGTTRDMNSRLNFASYAGFGLFVADEHAARLGARLMHISNGGVTPPNRSINLLQIVLGLRL